VLLTVSPILHYPWVSYDVGVTCVLSILRVEF